MTNETQGENRLALWVYGVDEQECAYLNIWYDKSLELAEKLGRPADVIQDCAPLLEPILAVCEPNSTDAERRKMAQKLITVMRDAIWLQDVRPAGHA